uniref:Uncharacterized protein n=1 Tax=Acanthochromis polyacanthus TaxID=80966 RepID=A0A3Q1FY28_9TELE
MQCGCFVLLHYRYKAVKKPPIKHYRALSPACTVPTVKHGGGSIIVWRCMSAAVVGHLSICDGTLNSGKYRVILQTHMSKLVSTRYCPLNTSRVSRTWLQELSIQVLARPAQSAVMSPIENLRWTVKRSVSKHKPKNLDELKAVIQEGWDKIRTQQ